MEVWSGGDTSRYIHKRPSAGLKVAVGSPHNTDKRRGVRFRCTTPAANPRSTFGLHLSIQRTGLCNDAGFARCSRTGVPRSAAQEREREEDLGIEGAA